MKKYKNRNFKLSKYELLLIPIFILGIILSGLFFKKYNSIKALYNIDKTMVDFIIPSPNKKQVEELSSLAHINKVIPYLYYSKELTNENRTVTSNLFIIENKDLVNYTIFSEELLIDKYESVNNNEIFLSDKLCEILSIQLGDIVSLEFEGIKIDFYVAAIYDDDERYVGGTMITYMNDDLNNLLGILENFNGAFICSRKYTETKEYLNKYKPLGDLRTREDFSSDELYQKYLENRENTDYTMQIFYKDLYIQDTSSRNDVQLNKQISLAIFTSLMFVILFVILIVTKVMRYLKYIVEIDLKNNFTINQEQEMFNRYFLIVGVIILTLMVISFLMNSIINSLKFINILHIILVLVILIVYLITWMAQFKILKKKIG